MFRMISVVLMAVSLSAMGAQQEFQRIKVSGYRLVADDVVGDVQDISTLKGLSVSPASGQVWSNALDVAANANVFEVTVPFGYRLGWWMESADDNFDRTDGERIAGSEGVTRLVVDFRPDGRTWTFIAPVLEIDDNRTFELRKSRFGSGTVGTNYATYACQKGDVFHLSAVPTRDPETALDLSSFRRWSDGSTEPRRDVLIDTNAALTAEFVPASWKVSFDPTGGSVFPKAKTVTCEAAYGWMPDPVRSGHDFTGWFNQPLNGNRVAFETKVGAVGDHTLFAHWQALLYAVSATYGGTGIGKVEGVGDYPFGAEVLLKAEPFEGYRFAGWADGETRNPRRIRVTGDVAYEALFEVATYEVSFSYRDEKGALVTTSPQTVSHGEGATPPDEELYDSWPEHAFVNWSTEEYKKVTRDLSGLQSVAAIYDDVTYAVCFAYRDRDGNAVTTMPQHVVSGTAAVPPGADTADIWKGHALQGWEPDYHRVGRDLVVEAQYERKTYSVTFAYRDADGKEAKEVKTYSYGDVVSLDDVATLKDRWPRHTFKYWSLHGKPVESEVKVDQDLQISAVYEGYAAIRYLSNGGEGEMPTQVYTNDFGEVLLASNTFTKTGYSFQYWTMGDEKFSDGQSVRIQDGTALVLTAQWAPIHYTFSFDANGGEIPEYIFGMPNWYNEKNHDARYGEEYSIQEHLTNNTASIIAPDGKTFSFWSLNKDEAAPADGSVPPGCYKEAISNLTTVAGSNVTLYAIWKGNPQTVYVYGQLLPQELAYGSQLEEPEYPVLKPGYLFSGVWTTNGVDAVEFPIIVTHGFNLDPLWTPNLYRVKFDGNRADGGEMEAQAFTYDKPQTLKSNAFTRTGYSFVGWTNETATGTSPVWLADGAVVSNLTAEADGEVTLKATWSANRYTVKFLLGEGSDEAYTQAFIYDKPQALEVIRFAPPSGQVFDCWTNKAATGMSPPRLADGAVVSNLTAEADGIVELTATWRDAPSYDVVYLRNGSDVDTTSVTQRFACGEGGTLASNRFVREGYTFDCWTNETATGTSLALLNDGATFSEDLAPTNGTARLSALWTPNRYWVKFDGNGADGEMEVQEFTYDEPQTLTSNAFTKTGHSFSCWTNEAATGMSPPRLADCEVVSNLTAEANATNTLLAVWTANKYSVVIDGERSAMDYGSNIGEPEAPDARNGYTFTGWTTNGAPVESWPLKVPLGGLEIRSAWTPNSYKVMFLPGEGSGEAYAQAFTYDDAQALMPNGFTPPSGQVFDCWTNKAATGMSPARLADGEVVSNLTAEVDGVVELTATWRDAPSYEVVYRRNGSDGDTTSVTQRFVCGEGGTLASNQFARTGYTFDCWTNETATGKSPALLNDGAKFSEDLAPTNGTARLCAVWTPNRYWVKFDGNDADGEMEVQAFTYDVAQALTSNAFAKTGHTFSCWTNETATGTSPARLADGAVVSNLTAQANGEVTLRAVWSVKSYNLSFDGENPVSRTYGQPITLIDSKEKTGYVFSGWYDGEIKYEDGMPMPAYDLNLVSKYEPIAYTIAFDANGGSGPAMDPFKDVKYDQELTLPACVYTREGYDFVWWTTNATGNVFADGTTVSNLTTTAGETVTLFAQWKEKEPTYPLSIALKTDLPVTSPGGAWKVNGESSDKAGIVRTSFDGTLCVEIPGPGTLDFDFANDTEVFSALKYSFGEKVESTKSQGTITYTCEGKGKLIFSGTPSSGKTWTLSNFVWTPKSE